MYTKKFSKLSVSFSGICATNQKRYAVFRWSWSKKAYGPNLNLWIQFGYKYVYLSFGWH